MTTLGRRFHAAAPGPAGLVRYALIDGAGVIVYTNRSGGLSLDIGERFRIVAAQAASTAANVERPSRTAGTSWSSSCRTCTCTGETRLPGTVLLTRIDSRGPNPSRR